MTHRRCESLVEIHSYSDFEVRHMFTPIPIGRTGTVSHADVKCQRFNDYFSTATRMTLRRCKLVSQVHVTTIELVVTTIESMRDSKSERTSLYWLTRLFVPSFDDNKGSINERASIQHKFLLSV